MPSKNFYPIRVGRKRKESVANKASVFLGVNPAKRYSLHHIASLNAKECINKPVSNETS